LVFTFLVPAYPGSLGNRAVKRCDDNDDFLSAIPLLIDKSTNFSTFYTVFLNSVEDLKLMSYRAATPGHSLNTAAKKAIVLSTTQKEAEELHIHDKPVVQLALQPVVQP